MKHTFLAKVVYVGKMNSWKVEGVDVEIVLQGEFGQAEIQLNETSARGFPIGTEFLITLESEEK